MARAPSTRRIAQLVATARSLGVNKVTIGDLTLEIGDLPSPEPQEQTAQEIKEEQMYLKKIDMADLLGVTPEDIEFPEGF